MKVLQAAEALTAQYGPLFVNPIAAGFPSPADDYTEGRISLDEHLIHHKEATFFLRVEGDSMRDLGIFNGDLRSTPNRAMSSSLYWTASSR